MSAGNQSDKRTAQNVQSAQQSGQDQKSEDPERRPFPICDDLSYPLFLERHLRPNTPFLLSSKATAKWPARSKWVNEDGTPNLNGLRGYADQVVPVADTLHPEFSEFRRSERPLGEVLDLWQRDGVEGRKEGEGEGEGLYVKDWHLIAEIERQGGGAGEVYTVPECLRDDWLNPPFSPGPRLRATGQQSKIDAPNSKSTSTSDFRFTYLGPAGTYTPLHRDVYSSYSWSANIAGRKLWWLFPPEPEVMNRILANGEPIFDVRELEDEGGGIKVVQHPGEVIWVPSGWYHQVLNLDFCISINHNFFSSPTLPRIYHALVASQERVEASIDDVREMIIQRLGTQNGEWEEEWLDEVQGLLERDAGWGWKGFWECVRRNLNEPPLLIAQEGVGQYVLEAVRMYKERREWDLLHEVRGIVLEIEQILVARNATL